MKKGKLFERSEFLSFSWRAAIFSSVSYSLDLFVTFCVKTKSKGTPITGVNLAWATAVKPAKEPSVFVPGKKQYEFSNHLGNVLVTISDLPLGVDEGNNGTVDYYMPNVLTVNDYEPFGAPLEGRTEVEASGYRFGFNG